MSIPQIKKSSVLHEGTHSHLCEGEKHFKNITQNIRIFNGRRCTYKTVKPANGKQFFVYLEGKLIKEVSLLSDRNGWELSNITYESEK